MEKYYLYPRFSETFDGEKIIISKTARTRWSNATKEHYISMGYDSAKQGELFDVCVVHLLPNSTAKIIALCPVCNREYYTTPNRLTINNHSLCRSCANKYDLYGIRFSRLLAIEPCFDSKKASWVCLCDCGLEAVVRTDQLIRGKTKSCGCIHKEYLTNRTGENHPSWIPREDYFLRRSSTETRIWKIAVHERDGYKCFVCKKSGGSNLVAHHLNSFAFFPDEAWDVSNGVTLCKKCHHMFHNEFLGGYVYPCTKTDFEAWVNSLEY